MSCRQLLDALIMSQGSPELGVLESAASTFLASLSIDLTAEAWETVYGKALQSTRNISFGVSGGGIEKGYNKDTYTGRGRKRNKGNRGNKKNADRPGDCNDGEGGTHGSQGWACPFYRLDPYRFIECGAHRLNRFSDMTQHLERCHVLPDDRYCSYCWAFFKRLSQRDEHVESCQNEQPRERFYQRKFEQLMDQINVPAADLRSLYADSFYTSLGLCEKKWLLIWRRHFCTTEAPSSFYMDHLIPDTAQLLCNQNHPALLLVLQSLLNGWLIVDDALRQVQDVAYQATRPPARYWLHHARNERDQVGENAGQITVHEALLPHGALVLPTNLPGGVGQPGPTTAVAPGANPDEAEQFDLLNELMPQSLGGLDHFNFNFDVSDED